MKLYRYEKNTSLLNYTENTWWGFKIDLIEYDVIKETPKGYWIIHLWRKKFILKSENGKKRFAYETKEKALINLKLRTIKSVKICNRNLRIAQGFLNEIEKIKI